MDENQNVNPEIIGEIPQPIQIQPNPETPVETSSEEIPETPAEQSAPVEEALPVAPEEVQNQ
ncbi:MAG: hypothetical protein KGI27_13000 [Thaumarchaeota archaeon]|nr:hypothetical protein [Nitrososphaerota archaeon]